jgi:branched-chain amino acid aminotransferase
MKVEERKISIREILTAHGNGTLTEAFGCGTAATIAQIIGIGFEGKDYTLPPVAERKFSNKVDETLRLIRKGKMEDKFHWMLKVL